MEKLFLPIGSYENILAQIGRWKVISIKNLYEIMPVAISYQGFAKQIRKLESSGFVSSFLFPDKSKYIYLTRKGVRLVPYGVEYSNSKEMIIHDLKCGIVLRELLKFENFLNIIEQNASALSRESNYKIEKYSKKLGITPPSLRFKIRNCLRSFFTSIITIPPPKESIIFAAPFKLAYHTLVSYQKSS